eukprot:CAMPEP_0117450910 /NCGR_PEP_ID=MMETSP0759-20121206/8724_1 /TAXON_ID=63605 /ORGANISM="Percolomonas cosmopolitus, Strain WS" /LENGTH=197 /DNA_ID=CAMNT_0005243471 /DNA_START=309 /DNA_END=899 /DNA_ORIENTATION=-
MDLDDFFVDFLVRVDEKDIRVLKDGTLQYSTQLEIPIHFRYHAPLLNQSYVTTVIPERPYLVALVYDSQYLWPEHFLREENVIDAMLTQYSSAEYANKIELVHPTSSPDQKELVARIPIGRLEHQKVVSPVTLFVSTLGALLLCICIMIYASRIPIGRLEHQKVVSPVTLFVSTLGALLLCICIMIYASRIPIGRLE